MKVFKNFTLFVIYPVTLIVIGFLCGVTCMRYFYPGNHYLIQDEYGSGAKQNFQTEDSNVEREMSEETSVVEENEIDDIQHSSDVLDVGVESQPASLVVQKLNANTSYVLEEVDLRSDTVVETTWKLPSMYIGMNREQFVDAMEIYETSPPLDELQKGFVSLEVISFSPQKVVVRMNYEYEQPVNSYYLKVENNYVSVYLEDMVTHYMDTDICLKDLPDDIQQNIIGVMYMPDDESLYNFLENYSS